MITNNSLTVYHKGYDAATRLETWVRYNYPRVWFFGGKGAGINKGYVDANDVEIRIPLDDSNFDLYSKPDIRNFSIGDIVVEGTLNIDIQTQQDLKDYQTYNIRSINNNDFGRNKHIHIGGK